MGIVTIDRVASTLEVDVTFTDLLGTTTALNIHSPTVIAGAGPANVATMTPTFTGFPLGVTSGSYNQTFDLNQTSTYRSAFVVENRGTAAGAKAALANSLSAGTAYLNIHTIAFPGGEIRGFLNPPRWNVDDSGDWSGPNWKGGPPNAPGAAAVLGSVITQPRNVTLDLPVTFGRLDFNSVNSYTISGTNALTLDADSGVARFDVAMGDHTVAAPVVLADSTMFTVTPADSVLTISSALTADGRNVTKAGTGTLALSNLRAATLSIDSGAVSIASRTGEVQPSAQSLNTLSIAGGFTPTAMLDLHNNALVIGSSSPSMVRQQIVSGRGGSGLGKTWTGLGITSSTAATANISAPESRSIGYARNGSLPLGPYTNFRGQPVGSNSVLMAFTRTGDANLDGIVNDDDVTIVGANYAPGISKPSWALGDFDYNGVVDDDDVTLLGVFYRPTATAIPAPAPSLGAQSVSAIPEPSTVVFAGLAIVFAAFALVLARLGTSHAFHAAAALLAAAPAAGVGSIRWERAR